MWLDPGEDVGSDPGHGDGQLTPHNSAGGTLPAEPVVTDEFGVATFSLVFPKSSAVWIVDRVTATTFVLGTETQSSTSFRLPYLMDEGCAGVLPDSGYGL